MVTVPHELLHTIPFSWDSGQMEGECGKDYHNAADRNYGNGVEIWDTLRFMKKRIHAVMGPAHSSGWITQCSYWHLLDQLVGSPDPDLFLVRGFLGRQNGQYYGVLSSAFQLEGEAELEKGSLGAEGWGIVLRDLAGQELGTYPFPVLWKIPDVDEERDVLPFTFRVPELPGVAKLELVGPGGVLDSRKLSAHAPQVTIKSPANGRVVQPEDGIVRIEWSGSDPDGDTLTYMVFYSVDGGENWRLVSYQQEETTFALPVRGLPVGPRVRVIATDGARSAQAEVGFTYAPPRLID